MCNAGRRGEARIGPFDPRAAGSQDESRRNAIQRLAFTGNWYRYCAGKIGSATMAGRAVRHGFRNGTRITYRSQRFFGLDIACRCRQSKDADHLSDAVMGANSEVPS